MHGIQDSIPKQDESGNEGVFDAGSEVAAIREEIVDLRGMKAEIAEIKSLLKRFCSPNVDGMKSHAATGEVNIYAPPTAILGGNLNWGSGNRAISNPVNSNVGNDTTAVQFYIESNTVVPSLAPVYTNAVRTSL